MIRAVIDTNVLVSAMISLSGNEAMLLLAVKEGFVRPCFLPLCWRNIPRFWRGQSLRFPRTKSAISLNCFTARVIWCDLPRYPACLPIPRTALRRQARCCASRNPGRQVHGLRPGGTGGLVVTGNKKDFPEDQLGVTRVVSAREFLNLITPNSSEGEGLGEGLDRSANSSTTE
jgi:hypothetical protein